MSTQKEQQTALEFAPDRSTAGFRLHCFSVLNWGTFHQHVCSFTPDGRTSLLSGANGAGKSTLADAILTLLIDSRKRNYNQASAGGGERKQRKERSERDYILGTYSEKHDDELGYRRAQQLRKPGQSITVLLGHFFNETFQTHVTLVQLLWVNASNRVDRIYLVVRKRLSIEDDFSDLGGPADVRQRLRDRGYEPLDTFSVYSQRFHEALYLSAARNPMDIFNQAVCIKDITDLTSFIRRYMLDDGGAPLKLEQLRSNFDELRLTYERIEREKQRLEQLNEIRLQHQKVTLQDEEIERWQQILHTLPLYFAGVEVDLREVAAQQLAAGMAKANAAKVSADLREEAESERIQVLEREINSSEEGRRLQQIEQEIRRIASAIEEIRPRHERFMQALERSGRAAPLATEGDFAEALRIAEADQSEHVQQLAEFDKRIDSSRTQLARNHEEQAQVSAEVRSLLERRSNMDSGCVALRDAVAKALRVKPEALPLVGELVQVKAEHQQWSGALERLLRPFATSILVPSALRLQIDAFAHENDLQGVLVYQVMDTQSATASATLPADAACEMLEIHPQSGEVGDWLRGELERRFRHHCCLPASDPFASAAAVLLPSGLSRDANGERRKDGSHELLDTRYHVLGWDNSAKLRALEAAQTELQAAESAIKRTLDAARKEQSLLQDRLEAARLLPQIAGRWAEIDYAGPAVAIEQLRVEEKRLRRASNRLQELQLQLKDARVAKSSARAAAEAALKQIGELALRQADNDSALTACREILAASVTPAGDASTLAQSRDAMVSTIKRMLGFPVTDLRSLAEARDAVTEDAMSKRRKAYDARNEAANKAKYAMQRFLDRVQLEDSRLHDQLYSENHAVPGYNDALYEPFEALRQRIEAEDLPKNQQRFRRLLQTNLIEDVAGFDGLLTDHAETIRRRVLELNGHLKQVDFDRSRGTYIQLVPMRTNDDQQKWFRNLRTYALENSTRLDKSDEDREETFKRVRHLLDELAKDEKRTQRVIDVRNWFEFRADEILREGDRPLQSYSGASGKSGGEKNRLASTILATAIAYQYGISVNHERQSDTFRLVVVDEMFSKTDDEFSTYLLELFKTFHLQLIIIQPLDSKIHLVQKYVERYHIVTRGDRHSVIHNLTVREYAQLQEGLSPG